MSNDEQAIAEIAAVSDGDAPHTILHYLYVPSSVAAAKIANELKHRGFCTEERLSGDGVNWLVLARHQAVPSKELMASICRSMKTLIANVGGEYDGWEADVRRQVGRSPAPH